MIDRFAPTDLTVDLSKLSDGDRGVLAKLVEASKIIDALFLRQVWEGNEAMLLDLVRDETPEGQARLHYFLINKGPWSRLDHDAAVCAPARRPNRQARISTRLARRRAEIEKWIASLAAGGTRARHRLLHGGPPHAGGRLDARAVQPRVPERARANRRAAARGRSR